MTFAISRHAVVDLAQVLKCAPQEPKEPRMREGDLMKLLKLTEAAGVPKCSLEKAETLKELRGMYEPYIAALSDRLLMYVPPWSLAAPRADNWKTSAWARISGEKVPSEIGDGDEREHF
jgi:hypothetical protein